MSRTTTLTILCGGGLTELLSDPAQPFPTPMLFYESILLYPFAQPESEWQALFERYKALPFSAPHEVVWTLASADPKERARQRRTARWIIIPGGNEQRIRALVSDKELREILSGWNVIGSSAGSNVFATRYYSNDRGCVEEGSGALALATICHYTPDKESRVKELQHSAQGLPVIAIGEQQVRVIRRAKSN